MGLHMALAVLAFAAACAATLQASLPKDSPIFSGPSPQAPQASGYSPALAQQLVYYSAASYCNNQTAIASWVCDWCSPAGSNAPPLTHVQVIWNATSQVQGYVAFSPATRTIILAFRGSVGTLNWLEDFDFSLTPALCPGCQVSHGFYHDCLMTVLQDVRAAIAAITAAIGFPAPVLLTGHSLGAALVELLAFELATATPPTPLAGVVTFGLPRVGNPAWAAAWAATLGSAAPLSFRVTHWEDPVPHLPLEAMGYMHPPTEVFYGSEAGGAWKQCSSVDGEDPSCSNSVFPIDPKDHNVYLGISIDTCNGN